MKLKGKVAVITGASSGIGRATAKRLAKSGVKVVLAARRKDKLKELKREIEKAGGKALAVKTDVTKRDDVKKLWEKTEKKYGRCDILVNNAGIMPLSYMKNFHVDEWLKMVDVNLNGVLYCLAEIMPAMIQQRSGHIINISSTAGREVMQGSAVYSATKFGVRALSDGLRMELSPEFGIFVTCIEPGAVETELTESITDDELKEDFADMFGDLDFLDSDDIAEAVHYAASQGDKVNVAELQVRPVGQG